MGRQLFFLFPLWILGQVLAAPNENSFVVATPESSTNGGKEGVTERDAIPVYPTIYEMSIASNVSNRFAKTLIASKVRNAQTEAKETSFTVVLPEKAFISEFVMEVGGKSYKAYVKEKEEAKQIYNQAVASGQSAGHVAVNARDSNKFTVSVNVEPESKVTFLLTYEELLERKNDQYELILNIHPGQIVKDLNVQVLINETRPLKFVRTPSLRSGNEISKNEDKLDPSSDIQMIKSTSAVINFTPDSEKQKQFAVSLGYKESDGLSGQFVVQYDVERDPSGGEVLLQDGYFVHFFAPTDLKPLPKHVLFVLDSSGSMGGRKIDQLKDAMNSILNEIRQEDVISIIDFGNDVSVWDINREIRTLVPHDFQENYEEPFIKLSKQDLPSAVPANSQNLEKTKRVLNSLYAMGGTYMIGGLETALYLAKAVQDHPSEKSYQPLMIFLTDGEPNVGLGSTEEITRLVTRLNSKNNNVPIFSLSFGRGADKEFLRKLSLKNLGFNRHIYEASDASLQLQDFYKQISSPLLSNITFEYSPDAVEITKTQFPIYFKGSDIVITGRYNESDLPLVQSPVSGWDGEKYISLKPTVHRPVTSLERLWAYLTVKQTLEERELSDNKKELTKKALDLALKYSFVTDVTSLVVVKPNETSSVNTEDASEDRGSYNKLGFGGGAYFASTPLYSRPAFAFGGAGGLAGPPPAFYQPQLASMSSFHAVPLSSMPVSRVPVYDSLAFSTTRSSAGPGYPTSSADNYESRVVTATTSKPNLADTLPWLASTLNPNGTLTVGQSTYELEGSSPVGPDIECQKTPLNATETGTCTLLSNCLEVHPYLTDFVVYQRYFCTVNNAYAGVCCPRKVPQVPIP